MKGTKAFKNKFSGRCNFCSSPVGAEDGWTFKAGAGWGLACDACSDRRGFERVSGVPSKAARGVADRLAAIFEQNEATHAAGKKPLTDEQIAAVLTEEFPTSSPESRTPGRVRMYRSSYNRGVHSYAGRTPKVQSREYGDDGQPVEGRSRPGTAGVGEERVRQILAEESAKVADSLREETRRAVRDAVAEAMAKRPPVVSISFSAGKAAEVDSAGKHPKFVAVLKRVEARVPVLLVGPAGCGKTHLARQVAEALDLPFTFNSMSDGVSESALLGRVLPDKSGQWKYAPSPFVTAYRDGGVHLLDEIDAADPNLLVAVNAAIANGVLALPFADAKPVKRHKDCVLIAAANTFGNGADRQYVGRNQLDAATVDRFRVGTVEMDYDPGIERAIAKAVAGEPGVRVAEWMWSLRESVRRAKLRRIVSTRAIEDAAKLVAVGVGEDEVRAAVLAGWTEDELNRAGQKGGAL